MILQRQTVIAAPLKEVFEFFSDPRNLGRLTPPSLGFQIISGPEGPVSRGDRIEYRIRLLGVPFRWVSRITEWREGEFTDIQEVGPYGFWTHTHRFELIPEGVLMHDIVEYELPLGILGRIFGSALVKREVRKIFDYRAQAIHQIFEPGGSPSPAVRESS